VTVNTIATALWIAAWACLLWPLVANYRAIPYAAVAASLALLWPSNGETALWLLKMLSRS